MLEAKQLRSLDAASAQIQTGDLLLFRSRGLIAWAGRGRHSHAAMAAWWSGELFCMEVREWKGGRAVTLQSQVELYPASIDHYRIAQPVAIAGHCPEFNRLRALEEMQKFMGQPYGWRSVSRLALRRCLGIRFCIPINLDDEFISDEPRFCSEAVSEAHKLAGRDPQRDLGDNCTEPADLARSNIYEYVCTLLP